MSENYASLKNILLIGEVRTKQISLCCNFVLPENFKIINTNTKKCDENKRSIQSGQTFSL